MGLKRDGIICTYNDCCANKRVELDGTAASTGLRWENELVVVLSKC